jgi:hypothetical protein
VSVTAQYSAILPSTMRWIAMPSVSTSFPRCRDAEQLSGVDTTADDRAHYEVAFRHLQRDLVPARRRLPERLSGLLDPFPVGREAGQLRVVHDHVLGDELVQDAPVARVVAVERIDVAADQRLVLLR